MGETGDDEREPYGGGDVPSEHAIRGAWGTTTSVREPDPMDHFLREAFNAEHLASEGAHHQYRLTGSGHGQILELVEEPDLPQGTWHFGEGTIHHHAFDVGTSENQLRVKDYIVGLGYTDVSDVKDRGYFFSVYLRTPGGALFELAYSTPQGFTIDEAEDELGTHMCIPPHWEDRRPEIEQLEPIDTIENARQIIKRDCPSLGPAGDIEGPRTVISDFVDLAPKRNRGWPWPEDSFGLTPMFGEDGWCHSCGVPRHEQTGSLILQKKQFKTTGRAWMPSWQFDVVCAEREFAERLSAPHRVQWRDVERPGEPPVAESSELAGAAGGRAVDSTLLDTRARASPNAHGRAGAAVPRVRRAGDGSPLGFTTGPRPITEFALDRRGSVDAGGSSALQTSRARRGPEWFGAGLPADRPLQFRRAARATSWRRRARGTSRSTSAACGAVRYAVVARRRSRGIGASVSTMIERHSRHALRRTPSPPRPRAASQLERRLEQRVDQADRDGLGTRCARRACAGPRRGAT